MRLQILVLLPLFALLSCGTKKKTKVPQEANPVVHVEDAQPGSVSIEVSYVGFIALDEECGFIIEVKTDNDAISFAPRKLDEHLKKPGMRVRFSTNSTISEENKCGLHFIIDLTRITPLRQ